jgi:Zn-dependent protease with chaperone function
VRALFEQVSASGTRVRRPSWGVARIVSYAIAAVVDLLCVALLAVAAWLIVTMANFITVVLAIFALLLAYELRPRLGSLRRMGTVRYRNDAPVLFGVLDQIAAEVGAKPVHAVVADGSWNASYSSVGWRRRRVVTLGLPLWDVLSADQKVAVLGHEFAHGVNGDARHGVIVGTSLATLARLYSLLLPDRLTRASRRRSGGIAELAGLAELGGQVVQMLLRGVIRAVFTTQQFISLRAGQRAEYLADAIGAQVGSPGSMADALDVMVTGTGTYEWAIERRAYRKSQGVSRDSQLDFWDQLRSDLEAVPQTELERRRRVSEHALLNVTDTHPPARLRISLLRSLPPSAPSVTLSAGQEDKIRAELADDYARIGA